MAYRMAINSITRMVAVGIFLAGCAPNSMTFTPTHSTAIPISTSTPTSTNTPTPKPIQMYDGEGALIDEAKFTEMKQNDPTVVDQADWLKAWGDWYGSAAEADRPMTTADARQSIVFYPWTDSTGNNRYKAAWKLDDFIVTPPAASGEQFSPPPQDADGYGILPEQKPVKLSSKAGDNKDLVALGIPKNAQLAAEQGTGDWVMISDDTVVARVNPETGIWELVLGGPDVAYNFHSGDKLRTMPEDLKQFLVPSPPETWEDSGLTYADGTPVPWGRPVVILGQNGNTFSFIPSLVRGFGEVPAPSVIGGKETYVVVESPAFGGSNFMIIPYYNTKTQQRLNYEINRLPGGQVPDIWKEGTLDKPLDGNTFISTYTFKGKSTAKEVVDMFKENTGVFLLLGYQNNLTDRGVPMIESLASNELLTSAMQNTRYNVVPSIIFLK